MNRTPNRAPIPASARVAVTHKVYHQLSELFRHYPAANREDHADLTGIAEFNGWTDFAEWLGNFASLFRLGLLVGFRGVDPGFEDTSYPLTGAREPEGAKPAPEPPAFLRCDGIDCPRAGTPFDPNPVIDRERTRQEAREAGWLCNAEGDYCPECRFRIDNPHAEDGAREG